MLQVWMYSLTLDLPAMLSRCDANLVGFALAVKGVVNRNTVYYTSSGDLNTHELTSSFGR